MKDGSCTAGSTGFTNQDIACQESMGAIVDRTARAPRHLGRRDHPDAAPDARERPPRSPAGARPIGLDGRVAYRTCAASSGSSAIDEPWQQIGAFAGEYAGRA